jgi:hypothetical protein
VRIINGADGTELRGFMAFVTTFRGGVHVATGDIDGDGTRDVIAGADAGGGPHVKVFSGATGGVIRSFFAYGVGWAGGVRVASADINDDGFDDIITGPGPGGGAHVRVFSGANGAELRGFIAYPGFRGGVYVAGGDVNGDGRDDIFTGAGAGGGPHVKVFSGLDNAVLRSLMALPPNFRSGVQLASADFNGDGRDDILAGAGPGASPLVRLVSGLTGAALSSFFAYEANSSFGVAVAAANRPNAGGLQELRKSLPLVAAAAETDTPTAEHPYSPLLPEKAEPTDDARDELEDLVEILSDDEIIDELAAALATP